MMMNRRSASRSRAAAESRQPQEDGRRAPSSSAVPRSPRSTASGAPPTTPQSAPPPPPPPPSSAPSPSPFPKTRCYRLNLEKPFDIRNQKSPLGRDYSGPPIHESDLPPAQGPVEYLPPPHLCTREENAWRRHSFGGYASGGGGGAATPSELMANLHVSVSEESSNSQVDGTSIAISTARIFRGIVVDRNGVITSMNSRAMRSQRGKEGANTNKKGEKSRQAAKIDKAKDLIDEVVENGGACSAMSDEENDPSKIVSLFVMGEYEELNDLVRDGSKKLRESKSLSDEAIFMYNRPRTYMHPASQQQPLSPSSAHHQNHMGGAYSGVSSPYNGDSTMSPTSQSTNPAAASTSSPISNLRKRVFSSGKERSRYKQVPRSAPPKLKSHPRDGASSNASAGGGSSRRMSSSGPSGGNNSGATSPSSYHRGSSSGYHNKDATTAVNESKAPQQTQQQQTYPNYFQQQCNFFPGNTDWSEAFGFSVNSLWNCGANGGHMSPVNNMSPHSNPSSPRGGGGSQSGAHTPTTTGGGVYHGSGAPSYHHQPQHHQHHQSSHHHSSAASYHSGAYHHHQGGGSSTAGYSNGGYSSGYGSPYNRDEGRNPSYGYGRGSGGAGVRDTVVM